ncbi:hypothetical protein CUT44_08735 [Streptomyces carminius]|uniref:Uncharacterized protein n=2 Tax=Streptomyces carminius TaxID=2665496 RepID=A0A2M8M1Q3_9ACTN|nr:hypothetical protein CUT44_08735 [Streptomyces carminius]
MWVRMACSRESSPACCSSITYGTGRGERVGLTVLAMPKAHIKHRSGQFPETHARLVAALFDGDWTAEGAVPAVLTWAVAALRPLQEIG